MDDRLKHGLSIIVLRQDYLFTVRDVISREWLRDSGFGGEVGRVSGAECADSGVLGGEGLEEKATTRFDCSADCREQ